MSYAKNPTAQVLEIIEENNYYPFGLKHKGYNHYVTSTNQASKLLFNGKELQDELGLNMYDMEARNYMPDIGRWGNMDELSESFFEYSPYNFSNNNPIYFSDPTGLTPESPSYIASTFIDGTGKVVEHRDDGDNNVYLVGEDWKKGGSKNGLSIAGKEKPGMMYYPGLNYQFDGSGELVNASWVNRPKANGAATAIGGAFDVFGFLDMLSMTTEGNSDIIALLFIMRGKAPSTTIGIKNSHHLVPKAVFKQLKKDLQALMKLNGKKNLTDLMTPFHGNHPQYNKYVKNILTELKNAGSMSKASIEVLQNDLRSIINKAAKEYDKTGKNLNEYFRQLNK